VTSMLTRSPARGGLQLVPQPAPPAEEIQGSPAARGRVVVGVDDTPAGLAALSWALGQARLAGTQVLAVRSWALGLPRHGGLRRRRAPAHPHIVLYFDGFEQRDAADELIRRSVRSVAGGIPEDVTITVQTPEGDPGAVLTAAATRAGDLLVVGHDRPGAVRRILHGSVSRYCSAHARCPVVVVPAAQSHDQDGQAGAAS
jgi:nucleotide-binding universal stress UspA family protein